MASPNPHQNPIPADEPRVGSIVNATSSRLERFATTGRSSHHWAMMVGAVTCGLAVMMGGATIGWNSASAFSEKPSPLSFMNDLELAASGGLVPEELAGALVLVRGEACTGEWEHTGFVTRNMIVVPGISDTSNSLVHIESKYGTSPIVGASNSLNLLFIVPTVEGFQSIEKGLTARTNAGSIVYQISGPGNSVAVELTVDETMRLADGGRTITFTETSQLEPGAPIVDINKMIVAFVNETADGAISIDQLDQDLSDAKLNSDYKPSECAPAADSQDGDAEAPATDN